MRRSDDTRLFVGEEHRRAVRGEDAKKEARTVGDHGVRMGPPVLFPWLLDMDDRRRMNLVDGREACAGQDGIDRSPAVFGNQLRIVPASVADVEPPHLALRYTATTSEKAMRQMMQQLRTDDFDGHRFARMMMSSSACSPTMNL